ncbi:MAG: YckD family protein [Chloroflexi bacterium]|nr:YckD family protein [Chloroflexota bacterium]
MNRVVKVVAASAVGLSMLVGSVGAALAADPTPVPQAQQWQRGQMAGRGAGNGGGPGFQAISGPVAELLGMSAADIHAERVAGKSLAEIAQAKGVSDAQLVDTILAARKSALDARVRAGTLTQEQADTAYQQMQTRVKESVNRTTVGPNPAATGLGLGWGRGAGAGYGQSGQGTGPGLFHRYGRGMNR